MDLRGGPYAPMMNSRSHLMPDDTPWNSLANHVYQLQKLHKDDNDRYEVLAARVLDLERKVEAMGDVNQLQWSWNNFYGIWKSFFDYLWAMFGERNSVYHMWWRPRVTYSASGGPTMCIDADSCGEQP